MAKEDQGATAEEVVKMSILKLPHTKYHGSTAVTCTVSGIGPEDRRHPPDDVALVGEAAMRSTRQCFSNLRESSESFD
jgi:hypothetical protein